MKFIKKLIIVLILVILIIGILVGVVFGLPGYNMYKQALEKESIDEKVASIEKKKNYSEFSELPEMYVNAVIATEDHRFYEHKGIDFISVARAIYNDIKAKEFVEGGSTISQQLAKNIYFTQEKTGERKVAEVLMASKLDNTLSKEKIFELYANTSYFGDGYYTIKDACKGYFKKELREMTDYECIMLAGIPNAPSVYAPTKNPDLTKKRARHVIRKMVENEYITQEEADKILKDEEGG